ncbi:MAG: prepilin-type N-terminal cleavage/methylation domain-containing protein [Elusimicrobia bacterium]|nr:prepilin-type N-terminal cleavage/methylation domain-containing protein [Elusimicrobiota bacterium]
MTRARSGFTLIELIVALGLSSAVLIAIYALLASMVKFQVEGARQGTIESWSIAGVTTMDQEIETANALVYPSVDGASADSIMVCQNWSYESGGATTGAAMNPSANTYTIAYCYDSANKRLMKSRAASGYGEMTGCPAKGTAPAACTTGNAYNYTVIATNVNRLNGANIFTRDDAINGAWVQYVVGDTATGSLAPGAGNPQMVNAKYMTFDFRIPMTRPYANSFD